MSNISINNLNPAGIELFQDSESFLADLNAEEELLTGGDGIDINIKGNVGVIFAASEININSITFENINLGNGGGSKGGFKWFWW